MKIEYCESPVPHIIVRNWFTPEQLRRIWEELDFLTYDYKLQGPAQTGSSRTATDDIKKHNHGIFLDEAYTNRQLSSILMATRKLWESEFLTAIEEAHWIFKYVRKSNQDSTLMSYYDDNDYYLPHTDTAVLTVLINLYKDPKKFTGGDLQLGSEDYIVPLENNRLIIFPSTTLHAVTPIKFNEPIHQFSGYGRYTITQFISTAIIGAIPR